MTGLRVGLTGGVACGKSTAGDILSGLGIPVLDTDRIARELVEPGSPVLEDVIAAFGEAVRRDDGTLDRAAVAERVFGNEDDRRKLNSILHPVIMDRVAGWMNRVDGWMCVVIVPLLYEVGAESLFDEVWCVTAEPETVARRLESRGWTPEHGRRRIAAQMPLKEKAERADRVIRNDETPEELEKQIRILVDRIRKKENEG